MEEQFWCCFMQKKNVCENGCVCAMHVCNELKSGLQELPTFGSPLSPSWKTKFFPFNILVSLGRVCFSRDSYWLVQESILTQTESIVMGHMANAVKGSWFQLGDQSPSLGFLNLRVERKSPSPSLVAKERKKFLASEFLSKGRTLVWENKGDREKHRRDA